MKRVSLSALLVASIFALLALAIPPAVVSQSSEPQDAAKGKRVFVQSCASCHNAPGAATRSAPALKGYYRQQPRPTDTSVRATIEHGRGRMPAFTSLDKVQVDDLIAYLKTL